MKKHLIGLLVLVALIFTTCHFLTTESEVPAPPPPSQDKAVTQAQPIPAEQPAQAPVVDDDKGPRPYYGLRAQHNQTLPV